MKLDRRIASRGASPLSKAIPLFLILMALLAALGCSRGGDADPRLEEARGAYQQIRARAAELEEFFPALERKLGQEQGEALVKSIEELVAQGRRAYDSFLRSARETQALFEELESSGGEGSEYAGRLLALLEANRAEAMLVAESMLQVEDFARQLPLADPSLYTAFSRRIDDIAARILASREAIRVMEEETEEAYRSL